MYYIYKIQFADYIYIGSTRSITDRQYEHNYELRRQRKDWPLYKIAREQGIKFIECVEIEEVEEHERYTAEQYHLDEYSNTYIVLNGRRCSFDEVQYRRQYYLKHKDHITEYNKKWREANKLKVNHQLSNQEPHQP